MDSGETLSTEEKNETHQGDPPEREEGSSSGGEGNFKIVALEGMYKSWFLDYASYVILERAVPDVIDGLKPVQRRILHAMKEMDDGRYNKVANIIGQTMKYHPHGDASIGDALVQLGQKDLMVDTQGNWGNLLTGDNAAAPRYIEARLSKFALDVAFNPKTTMWKSSYDGRNKEPVALPVKFPLLLAQGVEGIAVGLASKIVPHNFNELIEASIKYLQGQEFEILPDFPTGGMADFSKYNKGLRGGKIRIRARIQQTDKKMLTITEIPFGMSTTSLIESIVAANDKGKIKIKKIDDNTSGKVEIQIQLVPGISPDQTIDALYAFSSCEISVSPNSCVIYQGKPQFLAVDEILKINTNKTVDLLKQELEIRKSELEEQWHFASLEKIFIEKRIYRKIEECETWEAVIETIDNGLKPYRKLFKRAITRDDILKLTEIKIKRISKFNSFQADEHIRSLEVEMEEVQNHLAHLIDFAINYYRQIKKKFGKDKDRKTEIRNFDTIEATMVAVANEKLYVNREEGFAGIGLKKDEYVCDCSDIDDIIVFREDGTCLVTKVVDKVFVGKNIIHIDVFRRNDDRTIYNMIYRDGRGGKNFVKRFAVVGVTRDKEYNLTKGTPESKILYFSANPNGEAEIVRVNLKPRPKMKITAFDFNFSELAIKGRNSLGNTLTKYSIKKIVKKEEGISTLGAMDIWYDESVKRLNAEGRGMHLGAFKGDDKILTIMPGGEYRLTGFDLTTHFDEDLIRIMKFDPSMVITTVYLEGSFNYYYMKRFLIEETDKKNLFISESEGSKLITFSTHEKPVLKVIYDDEWNGKHIDSEEIVADEFIAVKSVKAKGKRLSTWEIKEVKWIEPLQNNEPEVITGFETDEPDVQEESDVQVEPESEEVMAEDFPDETVDINEEEKATFFPEDKNPLPDTPDENTFRQPSPKTELKEPSPRKSKRKDEDDGHVQMSLF